MEDKQSKNKTLVILSIIIILIIIHPLLQMGWVAIKYEFGGSFVDKKYERIEKQAREDNRKAAERWIKEAYGATVSEVIEMSYRKKADGWCADSIFHLEAPFATGTLFVESDENHKVDGGLNIQGSRFLHLYSNWVKKQVGIEDENVELVIGFNEDSIDFKEIIKLSDDYREIFESIKESGFKTIYVKNILDLNNNNYKNYFYDIKDKYSLNGKIDNKYFYMELMNYDCDFFNIKESPIKPLNNSSKNLHISIFYWDDKIENIRVNYYN